MRQGQLDVTLLTPHWPCLVVPACVQPRWPRQRQVLARYQVKDLEQLFDQARQPPTITQPLPAAEPAQQQKQQQEQAQQQQHQQQPRRQPEFSPSQAFESSNNHARISSSLQHVPNKRLRPSRMDFGVMFTQLQAWRQRFLSAHVPRHCFDAPELGAWVRYLRKQHTEGQLEQWKVDSLNALGFEWELTDQEAKWHHLYHQLRRYRTLYGTTDIDTTHSRLDGCDWRIVARWLSKQARLLAKQRLSSQQRAMLQQLGVRLTVPRQLVLRTAQLQALNGTERRQLRKKWKLQDNTAHEEQRRKRQQELQQLLQQRRQQTLMELRRQALLQRAAVEAAGGGLGPASGPVGQQHQHSASEGQQELARIALQQLQMVHQFSPQQQQQQRQELLIQEQQQQEQQQPLPPQQQGHLKRQQRCGKSPAQQQQQQDAETAPQPAHACQQQHPPQQQQQQRSDIDKAGLAAEVGLQPAGTGTGGAAAGATQAEAGGGQQAPQQPQAQQQQQPGEQQEQKQQQRHLPHVNAGALLFQPNHRSKRTKNKSRQEKWLDTLGS